MTLMRKLILSSCHSQTCDPVRVKVMVLVQPMGLIASGHSPGLIVVPTLGHRLLNWVAINVEMLAVS